LAGRFRQPLDVRLAGADTVVDLQPGLRRQLQRAVDAAYRIVVAALGGAALRVERQVFAELEAMPFPRRDELRQERLVGAEAGNSLQERLRRLVVELVPGVEGPAQGQPALELFAGVPAGIALRGL